MNSTNSTHSRIKYMVLVSILLFSLILLSDDDAEVACKRGQLLSADKTTINLAATDNNKQQTRLRRKSLPRSQRNDIIFMGFGLFLGWMFVRGRLCWLYRVFLGSKIISKQVNIINSLL